MPSAAAGQRACGVCMRRPWAMGAMEGREERREGRGTHHRARGSQLPQLSFSLPHLSLEHTYTHTRTHTHTHTTLFLLLIAGTQPSAFCCTRLAPSSVLHPSPLSCEVLSPPLLPSPFSFCLRNTLRLWCLHSLSQPYTCVRRVRSAARLFSVPSLTLLSLARR